MQRHNQWPVISSYTIEHLDQGATLPDPEEQAENFVMWLGNAQAHPGDDQQIDFDNLRATLGAVDSSGVEFVLRHLDATQFIQGAFYAGGVGAMSLTFRGWQLFHELTRRSTSTGLRAFMAMPFGRPALDAIFRDHFKPAVAQAGFNLFRLDEEPTAGSIDERLRVEIRRCRFLVADLTHQNPGAYWEAGFAEGLGKPVIYTCEKSVFDAKGTHFDTNHLQTVVWEESNPSGAAEDLKATVRNTLPSEAKMNDA